MEIKWFRHRLRQKYHAIPTGSSRAICGRWWLHRELFFRLKNDLPETGDICKTCADINNQRSKPA